MGRQEREKETEKGGGRRKKEKERARELNNGSVRERCYSTGKADASWVWEHILGSFQDRAALLGLPQAQANNVSKSSLDITSIASNLTQDSENTQGD